MDQAKLEQELAQFPLYQYAFCKTADLTFSRRIRHICRTECPMYGKTWACPPAVGSVEECRARCMGYENVLLICTVAEVQDIENMEETLASRAPHEEITRQIRDLLRAQCGDVFCLSTEACLRCRRCSYPDAPCRHPDEMFPCVESHGIVISDLAEKLQIPFFNGNMVTWYSLLFYR